jgi:cysteine synthase A
MMSEIQLPQIVGNTPLVYLKNVSELTGCRILAKAEFMNPGGSVKDRTALGIIRDAEERGELRPGGVIVEGTAGNTGIGLTIIANALGYRSVVVMPQSQSKEKIASLEMLGADLILVPAVSYDNPKHYIPTAKEVAEGRNQREPNGVIWARQFDNLANRKVHYDTTGAEIWQQTGGELDGFICSVGTGGTLAGVSMALREQKPDITIGIADPDGSSLYNYYKHGELAAEGSSVVEGIGVTFLPGNLDGISVDMAYQVSDEQALPYIYQLLREEGLSVGGSSGVNIAGAVEMARDLGPGHTIVTILADSGGLYQSKLFNPEFLWKKGLPYPEWIVS